MTTTATPATTTAATTTTAAATWWRQEWKTKVKQPVISQSDNQTVSPSVKSSGQPHDADNARRADAINVCRQQSRPSCCCCLCCCCVCNRNHISDLNGRCAHRVGNTRRFSSGSHDMKIEQSTHIRATDDGRLTSAELPIRRAAGATYRNGATNPSYRHGC